MVRLCLEQSGLDYELWRHGASRCDFRGPKPALDRPYVAVLGGSESFGRFVERPYPALLGEWLSIPVANLSAMQAGLTLMRGERARRDIVNGAAVTVIALPGAQNMANPMYNVHPRRNDRFLMASARLKSLYPTVDFTELNFTRHLLQTLEATDPYAFDTVVETLRVHWVDEMLSLLGTIPGPSVLLWMSKRSLDAQARGSAAPDPLFVDRSMIDALGGAYDGLVEVVASDRSRASGADGMLFGPDDAAAAKVLPNPLFHAEVAEALAPVVLSAQRKRRAGNSDAPPAEKFRIRAFRGAPVRQ